MNRPTVKGLLIALATGLLLPACSSSTDIPKNIETPMLTDVSQLESPMTPYFTTREEKILTTKAVRRYQEQCVQRFGISPSLERITLNEDQDDEADLKSRYPEFSMEQIEKRIENDTSEDTPEEGKTDAAPGPEAEYRDEVMSGKTADGSRSTLKDSNGNPVPENGCGTEGWERVRGDIPHDYDALPKNLMSDAYGLMLADPRYVEAEKEWSACMQKLGYEFEHPHEAGESVAGKDAKTQLDMGRQNVGCVQEVNLAGRAMAIDLEYQYKLIKENEAGLRDVLNNKNKLLDNAKRAFK